MLLYMESRLVDNGGKLDGRHINQEDIAIAKRWREQGFIEFGRVLFHNIKGNNTHYVRFTPAAWKAAHRERMARSARTVDGGPPNQ
jgi:hypothetical protein